jgi:acetyl/propionyl-CoA carboxylase alpha subunit
MLAKVIVHGADRADAIERMTAALAEMRVRGVPSTVDFHARLMASDAFRRGEITAGFLDRNLSGAQAKTA